VNSKLEQADSPLVVRIKNLTDLVDANGKTKPTLVSLAQHYFETAPALTAEINTLALEINEVKTHRANQKLLDELTEKYNQKVALHDKALHERNQHLQRVVRIILDLCEGETYFETQNSTARVLGTLFLLTRENNPGYARQHQRLRPLYKAILALRLVDKILADDALKHPYLLKHRGLLGRFDDHEKMYEWTQYIAVPVITAALLQDIGLNHKAAQDILVGKQGKIDPFREISDAERKQLLQLNYQYTVTYLKDALTPEETFGSKEGHAFALEIIQNTFIGKIGIGDIIKIPQVYASFVLSTKASYSRASIPKSYILIEQLAKQQNVSRRLTEYFISMVGHFPIGFGVCFIPVGDDGKEKNHYEYAIVTRLNPEKPDEPICKVVSRQQQFCSPTTEVRIPAERNLYFDKSKQKLMTMDRERMAEIMSLLRKNFTMDDVDNHIPAYWEAHEFYADKKNQIIWR